MTTPTYEIQGRRIDFPVEVRDAGGAMASFLVPAGRAQRLVGDAFDVAHFLPGRTLLLIACIDYRDNDLGDYNEVAINFFVRRRGASGGIPYLGAWRDAAGGRLASYSWKMPVDQSFTREAGETIWGFPKTLERIEFDTRREGRFGALLEMDGQLVFELDLPRGGDRSRPASPSIAFSYVNGIPHQTRFTQTTEGVGARFGGSDAEIRLGPHPIADTLRDLGLPKRPLMTTWVEKMTMSFGPAEKL